MPSLKEFRNRIASVKSTRKITKAMQLVAAAKLRRAQDQAEAARPYTQNLARVVANLAQSMAGQAGAPAMLAGTDKDDVHLLVVLTADRGLAGGFNSSIVRKARERIAELTRAGKTVKIITVGTKGYDQLKRLHADKVVERLTLREAKTISFAIASGIGAKVRTMYEAGQFDVATLVYADFKSVISQVPVGRTVIPAAQSIGDVAIDDAAAADAPDLKGAVYEYEPAQEDILAELMPLYLNSQIFRALLENAAGEQGARMSAMDNATRNAGDMIDRLSLQYNRARQAQITRELIEIISGAEAL
jgi:F-type H+-transporting ATPase subunit gamma